MKIIIVLLVMSMSAATCANARDADGTDNRLRCSQLIIRNPAPFGDVQNCCIYGDPWIAANHMSNCCLDGAYMHDCSRRVSYTPSTGYIAASRQVKSWATSGYRGGMINPLPRAETKVYRRLC